MYVLNVSTHFSIADLLDKAGDGEIPVLVHLSNIAHLIDQRPTSLGTDHTKVLEEGDLSLASLRWRIGLGGGVYGGRGKEREER